MWKWQSGVSKGANWVWKLEFFDDAKQAINVVGKPLVASLAVAGLTRGYFSLHDGITGESTAHWVTKALYIAEQLVILIYFLTFSLSDLLECIVNLIVRVKKTFARSVQELKPLSEAATLKTSISHGTMIGHTASNVSHGEDVQQRVGEQDD